MIAIYTMHDIEKLLAAADQHEREEFAGLTGTELERISSPSDQAKAVVKQFCWKYQTPLGYLTRTPTFDEVCVDVAKTLKMEGLVQEEIACWELLNRVVRNLLEKMVNKMSDGDKEKFLQELFEDKDFRRELQKGGYDLSKVSAGAALCTIRQFGGFATYKVSLIVANQVARVLLGRGLSLAANVLVTRFVGFLLGPVGWLLLAWGINDLLGTNYKVVIPSTIYIYCIYARLQADGDLPWKQV